MNADATVEKANRIAVPGSDESQLFRDVLMATEGVERVGDIASKVPASKVGVTTAAPSSPADEDSKSWKSVVIGLSVAVVIITCLIVSAVLYKRKVASSEAERDTLAGDIENGQLDAVNPPSQAVNDKVEETKPIKEVNPMLIDTPSEDIKDKVVETRKPGKEVKAPLVDTNVSASPRASHPIAKEESVKIPTRGSPQPSRGLVSL